MKSAICLFNLLLLGFILNLNPVSAQGKLELSAGYGVPELFNLKVKYGRNIQIGGSAGFYSYTWYGSKVTDWSFNAEVTYHFSGKSKHVEQPPWYLSAGLGFFDLGVMDPYGSYDISFNPRIGRTINFSKKTGVNLDFGLFLPLSTPKDYPFTFKVLASGSLGFFIRL
jgi:hypothetical protein